MTMPDADGGELNTRNPYCKTGEPPTLKASVVAFVDILGFLDLIGTAEKNNTQNKFLQKLHHALSTSRGWLEDNVDGVAQLKELVSKDFYVLKAFTDNIVMGWPVRDDGESELGSAIMKLADFQFTMSLEGFFVRGGIAVGDAYIDDITVFGGALSQAYNAESRLARDPRIVLAKSAVDAVKQHLEYYGDPLHAPQTRELLCDADGQWFVNYLQCVLYVAEDYGPFYDEFLRHKQATEAKLKEFKGMPSIFAKYAWVAGYHNYFCDLHPRYFGDEHKIASELFRTNPRLIVDRQRA
jgi:hypothetical protein